MKRLPGRPADLVYALLCFGLCHSAALAQPQSKKPTSPTSKSGNGTIAYADLKNKKAALPYGEPFTVTGDVKDVQLTGGALGDLMMPQTIAGDYTTSDGNKGTITPAPVTAGAWQAGIGKLAADTSATFNFQFAGTLSAGMQQTVFEELIADPAYKAAVEHFVSAARGKASAAQMGAMTLLAQAAADVVTSALNKKGLTPKTPADLKASLAAALLANIEPIYNLGPEASELQNQAALIAPLVNLPPKDFSSLTAQELNEKLKAITDYSQLTGALGEQIHMSINIFLRDYQNSVGAMNLGLKAALFLGSSSLAVGNDTQSDIVSDLKKYAGFDVGALYSYRLSELRSFAMVNIYFGPVQLKPDALPTTPGHGEWLRERLSLTFGMAIKDLSGASKSKITSEDAFVYGLGFRLNKYFRISAGGMLYRTTLPAVNGVTSPANGTLRQEFFIGPSIDITALPALQSIFAKSKSN